MTEKLIQLEHKAHRNFGVLWFLVATGLLFLLVLTY